jgi:hypothetical protein
VNYPYPGTYNVTLKASGANGSTQTLARRNFIRVNSNAGRYVPYLETFEETTEAIAPNWIVENEDFDNYFWTPTNNGYSGSGYFLNNRDRNYGQIDALISPAIDLSNVETPMITFKYAFARQNANNNDLLKVYFSSDCGKTWSLRFTQSGAGLQTAPNTTADFVPSSASDWKTLTINNFISSDFTEGFMMKIELENRGGNHMYIDDFWVDGNFKFTPVLEFPRNGMDSINSDIYIDWKAVPFVNQYEFQLSNNNSFSSTIASGKKDYIGSSPGNEDTRHYVQDLSPGGTYYWRVRAIRGADISDWSDAWSFTVSATGKGIQYIDGSPVGVAPSEKTDAAPHVFIFPNPAAGKFTIQAPAQTEQLKAEIYNPAGVLVAVLSADANHIQADISHLAPGVYLARVSFEGQTALHRIIKY